MAILGPGAQKIQKTKIIKDKLKSFVLILSPQIVNIPKNVSCNEEKKYFDYSLNYPLVVSNHKYR
ncbi:MAG: hypothetical protein Q8Q86_03360 [Candidatus Daviesbacteria bacterium]|nr:hypothetical protein [Candidatus Daviesbacteria bacterium]